MNKTSKCLLFALSFLGSIHANVMSSFALGNVPPFGVEAIISDGNTNVQRGLDTWHRYILEDEPEYEYAADREAENADYEIVSDQPAAKEVQLEKTDVNPEAPEKEIPPALLNAPQPVVNEEKEKEEEDVPVQINESEAPVAENQPEVASKEEIPEETTEEVIKTKEIQTVNENETTEIEEVSEQPKSEEPVVTEEVTPVQTEVAAPIVSKENVVTTKAEYEKPVVNVAQTKPEVKSLKSVNEAEAPVSNSKEVKTNASKLTKIDPNAMMSQNVVKVALKYVPYLVALAKAKEAYTYIRKDRAFDLPHTSYRDLTMLPQFDEVKMFTSLLCGIFNIEMPTEDNMVSNYKQKLPNIVVANKYLDKILDDLYDCHEAQKNGTYKLNLSDLNFVNRMLISAVSNSEDDSSTLPVSKEDESTAKKLFGKKIASNLSNTTNEDCDAKAMLHKITNNEVKASI